MASILIARQCLRHARPVLKSVTRYHVTVRLSNTSTVKHGGQVIYSSAFKTRFGYSLLLIPGFKNIFKKKEEFVLHDPQEVLSNIPSEVFKRDVLRKKQKHGNGLIRFLYRIWKSFRTFFRFCRIVLTYLPMLVLYPLSKLHPSLKERWWKVTLYLTESLGPTFIKLGQWASTRRDLFSSEFCDRLSKLQRKTRQHSWFFTAKKLERAFGKNWRDIFVMFGNNRKPVGSGAVAQVYKAYMRPNMIPDPQTLEELLEEMDDSDVPDLNEAWEVMGFGDLMGTQDAQLDQSEADWEQRKAEAQLLREQTAAQQQQPQDKTDNGEEGGVQHSTGVRTGPHSKPHLYDEDTLIPVAVKVLHPQIYNMVSRDVKVLRSIAWVLEKLFPSLKWISLTECVEEFNELLKGQIDLRYEARSLEQFVANFEDVPNIRFPKPIRPYCKRDVLIESFEEGQPIQDFIKEDADAPEGLKERLATYGVEALLQMIFVDNFVHGDLHPGNILVQNAEYFVPEEETKLMLVDVCDTVVMNVKQVESPVRLVLLDTGITAYLSPKDKENFKEVFTAVVIGEGERVAQLLLNHSRINDCRDVSAFKREMAQLVNTVRQETIKLGKVQVAALLSDVFTLLTNHRVKMESNFMCMILAIVVLEGLGRSLDPELDIMEKAKPILLSSHF